MQAADAADKAELKLDELFVQKQPMAQQRLSALKGGWGWEARRP